MSASSVIYVIDLPTVGAFYEQCFGLVTVDNEDSYRVLESEAWLLTLVRAPSRITATIEITDPPRRRTDAPVKLVFAVRSIAETRARAAELGGQVDPLDTQWEFRGSLRCDAIDPEGNVIQLRQFGAGSS
jgi:predicted enzyme related to lactoylglutathione lyase